MLELDLRSFIIEATVVCNELKRSKSAPQWSRAGNAAKKISMKKNSISDENFHRTSFERPRKSFGDVVVGVSTFRRRFFDKMSFFSSRSVSPPSSSSSQQQQQQQQQRRKNCCQTNAAATNSISFWTTMFPTTTT